LSTCRNFRHEEGKAFTFTRGRGRERERERERKREVNGKSRCGNNLE